jgi:hypothetical protein
VVELPGFEINFTTHEFVSRIHPRIYIHTFWRGELLIVQSEHVINPIKSVSSVVSAQGYETLKTTGDIFQENLHLADIHKGGTKTPSGQRPCRDGQISDSRRCSSISRYFENQPFALSTLGMLSNYSN